MHEDARSTWLMFVGVNKVTAGFEQGVYKVKVGRCDWKGSATPKQFGPPKNISPWWQIMSALNWTRFGCCCCSWFEVAAFANCKSLPPLVATISICSSLSSSFPLPFVECSFPFLSAPFDGCRRCCRTKSLEISEEFVSTTEVLQQKKGIYIKGPFIIYVTRPFSLVKPHWGAAV